jgi:orotate phosphoribosyltransferase-like protein
MEHLSTQVEHQQIEWRRAKVLELSSQGHSQREIADIIHVGIGTVNRDLAYLNKQAQDNLKTHIQEKLPEQYQKCINGLNQVLKIGWNIVNTDSSTSANRLQALALVSDSYKYLMDLTTNGVVITDAMKFVQTNKEKLMSTKEDEQEATTNHVF